MAFLENLISQALGLSPEMVVRILKTVIILLIYFVFSQILTPLLGKRIEDFRRRYLIVKSIRYVIGFVSAILIVFIWIHGKTGFAAYLGILSAGLAIALQDPITNLAGWFFIIIRRPFALGDRVQVGEHRGDIIDIRLFMYSMVEIGNWVNADQSTGRIIHLPNATVFKQYIANYNQGFNFIWDEIPVTITFESDAERAEKVLNEILNAHCKKMVDQANRELRSASHKFLVHFNVLTPIVWTSVADHGVTLTLRYLCHPRGRRSLASDIWKAILKAFAQEPHVDFAYPTTRFYNNTGEGKKPFAKGQEQPPPKSFPKKVES